MVSSEKKLANAVGGKTARACDSCITKRARWYCAADDVFLCQFCDVLVHSPANPHKRVSLKLPSVKPSSSSEIEPTWHQGIRKKPRTPRRKNSNKQISFNPSLHLVPETDELNNNDNDQFLYQVPVFDPFPHDLCFSGDFDDIMVPSDLELAEFAADVESLLGKSQSFDVEALKVKEEVHSKNEIEMLRDPFELSFDYDSWDGENRMGDVKDEDDDNDDHHVNIDTYTSKKNIKMLKLDYEGIIAAWDDDRSPWITGDRPELDPNECMEKLERYDCGDMGMMTTTNRLHIGGREARVSRYKEKRRRRLFSKKIRYEVRKLNAEKRPRIKGRFVKRTTFPLLSK